MRLVSEEEEAESEESDSEGPNQTCVEVSNVPETVKEEVLKTYFEGPKAGGCANAVAECTKIRTGVFYVTFHDPSGK